MKSKGSWKAQQQLRDLARTRSEMSGGTIHEWLQRFKQHAGTAEACPGGHPEVALAFMAQKMQGFPRDENYRCPACGEVTQFSDDDFEQNIDPNQPGYVEEED